MPRGERGRAFTTVAHPPAANTTCRAGLGVTSRAAGDSDRGQHSRAATPASSHGARTTGGFPGPEAGHVGGERTL